MDTRDNDIKKALQDNLERIEDDSFTDNIVTNHLAMKMCHRKVTFMNFLPMIIALSSVFMSFGLVLLFRIYQDEIKDIGLKENYGLIILTISIIFLIYKWMEEITSTSQVNGFTNN